MINLFDLGRVILDGKKTLVTRADLTVRREYYSDCLEAVRLREDEARASTRLILSSLWTDSFIHSTTILIPMIKLAEEFGGARVVTVEKCRFIKPVVSELDLEAHFVLPESPYTRHQGAQVVMRCITDDGRHVEVVARAKDQAIYGGTWKDCTESFQATITGPAQPILAATMAEDEGFVRLVIAPRMAVPVSREELSQYSTAQQFATYTDIGIMTASRLKKSTYNSLVTGIDDFSLPKQNRNLPHVCTIDIADIDDSHKDFSRATIHIDLVSQSRIIGGGNVHTVSFKTLKAAVAFQAAVYRSKWTK